MIILSKILTENPKYENVTDRITNALCKNKEIPVFICGTKDIWMRDFIIAQCSKFFNVLELLVLFKI